MRYKHTNKPPMSKFDLDHFRENKLQNLKVIRSEKRHGW
ncbi:hypothetical protein GMA8713_02890 [Grimontia marina]|uniref:Uncharacterized protein n=1 Tax=Grimontia marina TaxID=646534 RepID=A0A128FBT5_9GAMM|nr:hypothetical protein GMA8713_02890 [Grimontia marina]